VTVIKFQNLGEPLIMKNEVENQKVVDRIDSEIQGFAKISKIDQNQVSICELDNNSIYFEYKPKFTSCDNVVIFGILKGSDVLIDLCQENTNETYVGENSGLRTIYKSIFYPVEKGKRIHTCEYTFDFEKMKVYSGMDDGDLVSY
jgi:hypothetical protein